jgi:uncharacterized protein (TIGR02271 family)
MVNRMVRRIRPGASVEWAEGHLGQVVRAGPEAVEVLAEGTNRRLFVPLDLVRDVRADGTLEISAARAELERLARPATGEVGRATEHSATAERVPGPTSTPEGGERTLELREEELVAHKELREAGEVAIRTQVEEFPGRLELEAYREEVEVEHVPVGQAVTERVAPWEEDGVLIVPVYEEQLVVTKRLVLREHLRVRRVGTTERQLFEDSVRRERLVIEDPNDTGLVHERYPVEEGRGEPGAGSEAEEAPEHEEGGFLEKLGRKVLK